MARENLDVSLRPPARRKAVPSFLSLVQVIFFPTLALHLIKHLVTKVRIAMQDGGHLRTGPKLQVLAM